MKHYRVTYESSETLGSLDGEADSEKDMHEKALTYLTEQGHTHIQILRLEAYTPKLCPHCRQPMGNLGLIYDECVNSACDLYAQDPRPFMEDSE